MRRRIRQLNNTERKNKKLSCEFKQDNTIYDLAKHIANLEKENKGTYLVAYIPSSSYWRPSYTQKKYKLYLQSLFEERNIPFLDISIVIDPSNKKDYSPIGPHLSREGYFKVSKYLAEEVFNSN